MTLSVDIRHRLGAFSLDAAFTCQSGVTALFGRSGSGKTSIIRMIAGLTKPDQGRIVFNGRVLADTAERISVPRHKRRIGYVFQEARLFPHLTVKQNLVYGRWFSPKAERGENFERIVDMLGIEALLDRRPAKLSGGEKQRVAIGRALLSVPHLLLMDEPLAALDDPRKAEILPYLERLRDETNVPIVYVSHSVAEVARLARHVIIMSDGRIEAQGPAMEVLNLRLDAPAFDRRETGALVEGRVERIDSDHEITVVALKTVRLHMPGVSFPVGRAVRIHIPARDVLLATVRPEGLSALNVLEGRIRAIGKVADGMVEVRLDCGGDPVLARITQLSCERLQLRPDMTIYAVIKTVAFDP